MYVSYPELKGILYGLLTLIGPVLLIAGWHFMALSNDCADPITYWIPAVILILSGFVCLFFGLETCLLRDDPDVWR